MSHRTLQKSAHKNTFLDAVAAVMACIPHPWTRAMIDDAGTSIISLADQWRMPNAPAFDFNDDDLTEAFLEERLGLDPYDAQFQHVFE